MKEKGGGSMSFEDMLKSLNECTQPKKKVKKPAKTQRMTMMEGVLKEVTQAVENETYPVADPTKKGLTSMGDDFPFSSAVLKPGPSQDNDDTAKKTLSLLLDLQEKTPEAAEDPLDAMQTPKMTGAGLFDAVHGGPGDAAAQKPRARKPDQPYTSQALEDLESSGADSSGSGTGPSQATTATKKTKAKVTAEDKPEMSRGEAAGLNFSVEHIYWHLKDSTNGGQFSRNVPVFMAGVMEYIVLELIRATMVVMEKTKAARSTLQSPGKTSTLMSQNRITPRHVHLAAMTDVDFSKLWNDVTVSRGGVLSDVHSFIVDEPKKKPKKKMDAAQIQRIMDTIERVVANNCTPDTSSDDNATETVPATAAVPEAKMEAPAAATVPETKKMKAPVAAKTARNRRLLAAVKGVQKSTSDSATKNGHNAAAKAPKPKKKTLPTTTGSDPELSPAAAKRSRKNNSSTTANVEQFNSDAKNGLSPIAAPVMELAPENAIPAGPPSRPSVIAFASGAGSKSVSDLQAPKTLRFGSGSDAVGLEVIGSGFGDKMVQRNLRRRNADPDSAIGKANEKPTPKLASTHRRNVDQKPAMLPPHGSEAGRADPTPPLDPIPTRTRGRKAPKPTRKPIEPQAN